MILSKPPRNTANQQLRGGFFVLLRVFCIWLQFDAIMLQFTAKKWRCIAIFWPSKSKKNWKKFEKKVDKPRNSWYNIDINRGKEEAAMVHKPKKPTGDMLIEILITFLVDLGVGILLIIIEKLING